MIFKQLTSLPIIFQVDEDIYCNIKDFLLRNRLSFNKVLIVSGNSVSNEYAFKIAEKYKWEKYILKDNTFKEVERLRNYCTNCNFNLLIAVGGGKIQDSVKRVSYLNNINHLSVPTIISNDGLISPIAVIRNNFGKTESIPGMMPMGVIIDITIINNSPKEYLRAAGGDILSNLSATNDWILANNTGKELVNDIAFHLSRSAANTLIYFQNKDLEYKPFLRQIIQGQINSGLAMSLAGTSRPCSGSEHLISHAIDYLNLNRNVLHGLQVGSVSLFILYIQDKLLKEHIEYARLIEIPYLFSDLISGFDDVTLKEIFLKSKEMRPGRYTILDSISEEYFVEKYYKYKDYLNLI